MKIILAFALDKIPANDLLFWGVKSWLKFFNPSPPPEAMWSEDSWILASIFWHDFETCLIKKKTFGQYPAILTSRLVNNPCISIGRVMFFLWRNEAWQCLCYHLIKSCASLGSVESSGEQNVMFADWAAGLLHTTPDPVTSERHVASMVEVGSIFVKLENCCILGTLQSHA